MNRVGHEGRGESVWLGWFLYTVLAAFAPIAEARGERQRAEPLAGPHAGGSGGRSSATAGTATGTGAPSSTTARRSARRSTTSAGSTRSPSRGRSSPAPAIRARARRAMAAVEEYLIRRGDGLVLLFTPPFDHGDVRSGLHQGLRPGHPRERRPVHPRRRSGRCSPTPRSATATRRGELFSILNPINHASTRAGVHRYKVEPYVMAADVYRSRRMSAAAAGPGTRARPAGCTRPASSRSWGSGCAGRRS